jgi:hypothetical protein
VTNEPSNNAAEGAKSSAKKSPAESTVWNVRYDGCLHVVSAASVVTQIYSSGIGLHHFYDASGERVACFPADQSSFNVSTSAAKTVKSQAIRAIGLALNAVHGCRATDTGFFLDVWEVDHSKEIELLRGLASQLGITDTEIGLECENRSSDLSTKPGGTL